MTAAVNAPEVDGGTVADDLVRQLAGLGVDVIFLNPGTDTAPVQEAVARRLHAGLPGPRVVLCPHEAVALAAAHAYFAAVGRPQLVMVHVDVGTQNLGAMMHNAFRGEAGVVVLAGRTPVSAHGELLGGRDHHVHWQQDVPDQAGIVRGYVKAALDLERAETMVSQLARAFQLAAAPTPGPVYVTAHRELLMEPAVDAPRRLARSVLSDPRVHGVPAGNVPDDAATDLAVELLSDAERPVIVTNRVGQDPQAVPHLVEVAELIGAVVVDRRERVNFPSTHPAYVTATDAAGLLADADLVLAVDCTVPWVPLLGAPSSDARLIVLDADPVKHTIPGWQYPADLLLQATPRLGLAALARALRGAGATPQAPWWTGESGDSGARSDVAGQPPAGPSAAEPLSAAEVARVLGRLVDEDDILIEEATTNAEALRRHLPRTKAGTLFHPGGSGLGWGLGGALGVKLARPDRTVAAVVGDGSFMFSAPVPALWAARRADAPFLTVVLANGGYAASRRPVLELYRDGASAERGDVVGTRFDDPPDYAAVAEACGAVGLSADTAEGADAALRTALSAVRGGRCAVVVISVASPWFEPGVTPWSC